MDLWHVTLAAEGRPTLWPDARARADATRATVRAGAERLVLFCLVDDHLHLVLRGERSQVGHRTAGIAQALNRRLPHRLDPARLRVVEGSDHLSTLVHYVGNQPIKHGIRGAVHAAVWEAGCVMDLVGARRFPPYDPKRLYELLPRLRAREVAERFGLPPVELAGDELVSRMGASVWVDAVRVACAVVDWHGREPATANARRVAVVLGRRWFGARRMTELVDLSKRQMCRLQECDPATERAARRQLWIRAFLAGAVPRSDPPPSGALE